MRMNHRSQLDELVIPTIPVYVVEGVGPRLYLMEDFFEYLFDRMDRTGEEVRFGCFRMKNG